MTTVAVGNRRAQEIVEGFSAAHVLVVGDAMVDHFIWGRVSRISPEAPVPVVDVQKDNILLGGSANVMNNIRAMEGRVYGVGIVGADEMGEKLIEALREQGIDTEGIVAERGRTTTVKTRIVAHGQQVVRFDRESRREATHKSVQRMIARIRELLPLLRAIVISDYNKGAVTKELIEGIRQLTASREIIVCVDPKRIDFSFYRGADIITPNHYEVERALGLEVSPPRDYRYIGEEIIKRYGFEAVLVTRGEEGMSLFEKGSRVAHTHFPADAKEVYDVTGAGDTVIGVFSLAMAAGASRREAAYLANKAAGIVVGKTGTATVSREELKKYLERHCR